MIKQGDVVRRSDDGRIGKVLLLGKENMKETMLVDYGKKGVFWTFKKNLSLLKSSQKIEELNIFLEENERIWFT